MKKYMVILLGVLLSACASYKPVDVNIIANELPSEASAENSVKIVVMRNTAFKGGGIDAHFYFDDEFVVTLARGNTYTFYTTPGEHKISTKSKAPSGFIPSREWTRELVENFSANQTYTYLFDTQSHGGGFGGVSMEIIPQP